MNKKIVIASIVFLSLASPFLALAALPGGELPAFNINFTEFQFLNTLDTILTFIWRLFIIIATILFVYCGFQFLTAHGDPGKLTQAKWSLVGGVIGVIVAIVAFSAVVLIKNTIGIQ